MPDISQFPRGVPGRDLRSNVAPNALWEDPNRIAGHKHWRYEPGKVFLGAVGQQLIGVDDDRHMMTIAGSRAGKGVSTIIPNLLLYPGSILVIDPKGENARITARYREMGSRTDRSWRDQRVFVLDPFGRSGHPTSSFNPLDMINPESDDAVDDAALIADGLVIPATGEGRHWSDSARNFLRGLILYVRVALPPECRNLLWVRRLMTIDQVGFKKLLTAMMDEGDRCNGVIRSAANSVAAKDERERSGVISTAHRADRFP